MTVVVQVCLRLITHTCTNIQFRIHPPIGLHKSSTFPLSHIQDWIAGRSAKCDRVSGNVIGKTGEHILSEVVRLHVAVLVVIEEIGADLHVYSWAKGPTERISKVIEIGRAHV